MLDELSLFYSDFSVEVVREDGSSFRAIFGEEEFFREADFNGLPAMTVEVFLRCSLQDAEDVRVGEALEVDGKVYYVRGVKRSPKRGEAFIYVSEEPVSEA